MKKEDIITKLESIKNNVNNIPVVGYLSCIKVVKAIVELEELQIELNKEESADSDEKED